MDRKCELYIIMKTLQNIEDDAAIHKKIDDQTRRLILKCCEQKLAAIRLHQSERRLIQQAATGILGFALGIITPWLVRLVG